MLYPATLAKQSCGLFTYCDKYGDCKGFGSFAQLSNSFNLSDCDTNTSDAYFGTTDTYRTLAPLCEASNPLVLDNTLKLNDLLKVVAGSMKKVNLIIYYLRGFDLNFPTNTLGPLLGDVYLYLISLEFFNNGAVEDMSCKNTNWLNVSTNIFRAFNSLKIFNSKFPSIICPSLFHMINYSWFDIYGAQMQFETKNYSFLSRINCNVSELTILKKYKLDITNATIHPSVFKTIKKLTLLQSSVHVIQTDIFKDFDQLRLFFIRIINLRYFYHFNTIEWLNHVNDRPLNKQYYQFKNATPDVIDYLKSNVFTLSVFSYVNDNNQSFYSVEFFPYLEYQYPDADFCLFAPFPHQNFIIPSFVSMYDFPNCTCNLRWLMRYAQAYNRLGVYLVLTNRQSFYDACYRRPNSTLSCNFTNLIDLCTIGPATSYDNEYFNMYDLKHTLRSIQSILVDIFGPVASFLAIVSNTLVIITIKKAPKQKKNPSLTICDGTLYKYMLIGAVINLIYSTVYFLFYTIKCNSQLDQYRIDVPDTCFQLQVYVSTISSVIKLVSNLALLQLSLNRFVLVGKDHNERLVQIANTKPKKFVIISLIVSALLSVVVYFEQMIFGSQSFLLGHVVAEDFYYHNYFWDDVFGQKRQRKLIVSKISQLPILSPFILLHDFFSYFFYCLVSTLIDAFTVKNLKIALDEKKKTSSINRDKESSKVELKSVSMIILSSFSSFLLRFPELFSIIFLYALMINPKAHYIFKSLCFSFRECLPIVEMTNVFYILVLCLNFIFYSIFDNNFKESLMTWIANLKNIFKRSGSAK